MESWSDGTIGPQEAPTPAAGRLARRLGLGEVHPDPVESAVRSYLTVDGG